IVCVCDISTEYFRLMGKDLLFSRIKCVPLRQAVGPWSELGTRRNDAELLLVVKDRLSQLVPTAVEEMHVADLLDPFWCRVMWRMRATGHVIEKERLVGCSCVQFR